MIPFIDHGGTGRPLHFLHANGYPPACYEPLFDLLRSQYRVFGMTLRPLWPDSKPEELRDWNPLSDDLLNFLDEQKVGPLLGVGHSIGAIVTLRAALMQPERFRALVLLDPVLFVPSFILKWNLARLLGVGQRVHPLIPSALKRRRHFDNLDVVFRGYRKRDVFRYFSDESLRAYISGIARPKDSGGFELAYSPEWEAHIYYTGVWRDMELWRGLPRLQVPTLIIRGAETDTFLERAGELVKRRQPKVQVVTVPRSTHLVPLEHPAEVFEIMQSFLKEIQ
ncbi:MAG: alpha/beta hydrolase [Chloroflexi bacterium]|nr:alpha/beta hydrolase [Chloroflexota bacterium]